MAIVRMQKVAILAHRSQREKLIEYLHEEGVMEICERKQAPDIDHTEVNFRIAELQFAIRTLSAVASKDILALAHRPAQQSDITRAALHTDVRGIVDQLHRLAEQEADAQKIIQEYTDRIAMLRSWTTLPYPLHGPDRSRYVRRILGTLPVAQAQTVRDDIAKKAPRSHIDLLGHSEEVASAVALVHREEEHAFEEVVTAHGWTTVVLPAWEGTAADLYEDAVARLEEAKRHRESIRDERKQLTLELPSLLKVERYVEWLADKQSVRESMGATLSTVTLLGWVPKKLIPHLERRLHRISPAIAVLRMKQEENEEAPILLKHLPFIAPFISVTALYGLPRPTDMDPTPALSPFFILFFALCLTDAGYGLALALIFGIALWKMKKSVTQAPLLWLLFFSGIVSMFVGILFGGYFGLTPQQVPAALTTMTPTGELWFKGQFWNLSQQTGVTFLQNLALALGLTHLFLGMFLAGFHKWMHGKKAEAFWMDFSSHILLGAIIFRFMAPAELRDIAQYVLYAGVVLALWGKGYGNAWYLRPVMGVIGLLNFAISMLSNGLSYLRILALGLVTGAMALAVNQVAVEMSKFFPAWLAIPVIIVIFLGGHLVSIALNTLGSFIHSGRLQFIEFFSQFFEGGGRPFAPFQRSS